MRQPVIAGNWKMFKTGDETRQFFKALVPAVVDVDSCDIVIAPPFTALTVALEAAADSRIAIAAQDVHWEKEGPFTGAVSARMLRGAGCTWVIVGHSERRQLFGETNESVGRKAAAVLAEGMEAIVCVGETLDEREADRAEAVVKKQLIDGLARLTANDVSHIIVAYEPVWAIGTGRTATPEIAAEMHGVIRRTVRETYGADFAESLRILYGGSVKPDNIAALMEKPDIDGALVGGASLKPDAFRAIIDYGK